MFLNNCPLPATFNQCSFNRFTETILYLDKYIYCANLIAINIFNIFSGQSK